MEKARYRGRTRAAVLSVVLLLAAAIVGCGCARFGDSDEASTPAGIRDFTVPPVRAGWVLVLRDGDLRLLARHWERQVTKTGDYWTGALTRDGSVIGLRRTDGGRSKLVRLKIDESMVTQTAEFEVNLDLPDGGPRHGLSCGFPRRRTCPRRQFAHWTEQCAAHRAGAQWLLRRLVPGRQPYCLPRSGRRLGPRVPCREPFRPLGGGSCGRSRSPASRDRPYGLVRHVRALCGEHFLVNGWQEDTCAFGQGHREDREKRTRVHYVWASEQPTRVGGPEDGRRA